MYPCQSECNICRGKYKIDVLKLIIQVVGYPSHFSKAFLHSGCSSGHQNHERLPHDIC